jgi:AcrR family transcriptional regulator
MTAGADLFATNGFDETTTADIAERADVSQRTLFRHFDTKEALLYGDLEEARLNLREALSNRPAGDAVLTWVIDSLLSLSQNHELNRERRLLQARLAARYPSVSAHSRSVVQAGWEREIIVAVAEQLDLDPMQDPRPEIIAGAAMSATRVATRQWTADNGSSDYMQLLANALRAIPDIAALA